MLIRKENKTHHDVTYAISVQDMTPTLWKKW